MLSASSLASPPSRGNRVPLPAQIALLLALVAVAIYLWSEPQRAEQSLARAPLSELEAASSRHPDDPRLLHYLALRLQEAGRPQEALDAALRAAERAPFDEDAFLMAAAFSGRVHGDQSAFDILNDYIKRNSVAPKAHRALALLYQKNGAHERALAEATKAGSADPEDADAFRIAAEEALVLHQTDIAETNARKAVALAPRDARTGICLSRALDQRGRIDDALAAAQNALTDDPTSGEAHLALGGLLYRKNRFADALAQFTDAKKAIPDSGAPLREVGRAQFALGRYAEARTTLEQARTLLPDDRTIAWLLVKTDQRLGDTTAAAREQANFAALTAYLDRVSVLKLKISKGVGDEERLRRDLARLFALHDDADGARQQYRLLILHKPDAVGARHEWAAMEAAVANDAQKAQNETRLAVLLDRVDHAISANQAEMAVVPLEAAIKANPDVADLYDRLGRVLGQAGGVEADAEAAFVKATKLDLKRIDFALDAAEMLASNQKVDAAEAEYRRILALAPQDPKILGALGRFLANERIEPTKNAEGERLLKALLTADPANADALYGLGTLSLKHGDNKAAIGFLEAFLTKTGQKDWADVWFSLARAYQLSGDTEKAAQARARYATLTAKAAKS